MVNSQVKGKRGELEAVHLLHGFGFPEAARRPLGDETNSEQGRDIEGTPGLCVQVQRVSANPRPIWKLNQAVAAHHPDEIPVALTRSNQQDWVATLSAVDFLKLYQYARERGYVI